MHLVLSQLIFQTILNRNHKSPDYTENINKNTNPQLTKQNTLGREITYARMIEKSDFKVDWGNEAIKISQKMK